jgi:preprotein translocase subunit SecA
MVVQWIINKIVGNYNDKQLNKLAPLVNRINEYYDAWHTLTDDQIQAKTPEFKDRLAKGESLDALLPEAYATVKQACARLV